MRRTVNLTPAAPAVLEPRIRGRSAFVERGINLA